MQSVTKPRSKIPLTQALFEFFEVHHIPYVVAGDSRFLTEHIPSDIDFIVPKSKFTYVWHMLDSFARSMGGKIVQVLQHEHGAKYFVLAFENELGYTFLHPDVCSDYLRMGRPLLQASELLARRQRDPSSMSFYVPEPAKAFIYYFLKKVGKGQLTKQQFEYLRSKWLEDPDNIQREIKRFWPNEYAASIITIFETSDYQRLQDDLFQFQKVLDRNVPLSLFNRVNEWKRKLKRLVQPTGLFVVFLGADGSGKSSVIAQIEKDLAPVFRRTKRFHLRPHFGKTLSTMNLVTEPHSKPPRHTFLSLTKLVFWWADYVWGYISNIYFRLARSTLVLFDRYANDILADPRRYRYGGSRAAAKLFVRAVPRPDIVILLDVPPEVLQYRKQEVTFAESAKQHQAYRDTIATSTNGYIVNGGQPLAMVVHDVNKIVLAHLAYRTQIRLKATGHEV